MDLLDVLGLSKPVADCAVCLEIYYDGLKGDCGQDLDALKLRCMQLVQPYVEGYIWQHEPLSLHSSLQQQPPWMLKGKGSRHPHEPQAKHKAAEQQPPFLWGVLRYEDSVEDEWFVVWLLLQLTQQLPGCTARCWDDDGEFLLIEAAYSLPRWLKPETASNRVWLRGGQLHIIPPPSAKHPSLPAHPSVSEALAVLHSGAVETRRKRVEACVMERLAGYPSIAQQQLQRTAVWLPRRLGLLLQIDPQQVSAAVAAFMTRQRDEVQAVSKGRLFPPSDMTTALVCLNRCMYAQLMQADFAAPKGYPTLPSSSWLGGDSARQHKAVSMGLKLTTGMELMALRLGIQPQAPATAAAAATGGAGGAGGDATAVRAANGVSTPAGQDQQQQGQALQQQQQQPQQQPQQQQQQQQQQQWQQDPDLASNPAWHAYKGVLQRSGYFDGELEGSARYRQLLQAAADAFTSSEAYSQSTALLEAPKQRLQQLLAAVDATAAAAAATAADADNQTIAEPQQQQQQQQQGRVMSPLAAVLDIDRQKGLVIAEDGDDWMGAEAEQLQQRLEAAEQLVATHTSKKQHKQQEPAAAAAAGADASAAAAADVDAEQLVSGFRDFVQRMAGVEGAEVPAATPPAAAAAAAGDKAKGKGGPMSEAAPTSSTAGTSSRAGSKQEGQQSKQRHKQRSAAAAAAAAELDFNPDAFLSELFGVLGAVGGSLEQQQQQQQQTPAQAAALLQQAKALQDQLEQQLAAFPGADTDSGNDPFGLFRSAAVAAAAGGGGAAAGCDGLDSDDYGSSGSGSSEEGSSFYGSDSEEDEALDQGLGRREQSAAAAAAGTAAGGKGDADDGPVLLHVPPPVSHRSGGGQPASEQQQQQHSRRHQHQQQQQQQQPPVGSSSWVHPDAWEVMTATDSDDDAGDDALSLGGSSSDGSSDGSGSEGGAGPDSSAAAAAGRADGFHDSYSAAMEAELAATTMAQTFERVRISPAVATATGAAGTAGTSGTAAGTSAAATASGELDAGLTPLDIDMNLIKSLVASYTAQGGLPGPASNLAGLLGLQLPTEVEVQEEVDRAGEGQ